MGTTCIQIPEELIYALGASPIRLCNGSYYYDNQGAEFAVDGVVYQSFSGC